MLACLEGKWVPDSEYGDRGVKESTVALERSVCWIWEYIHIRVSTAGTQRVSGLSRAYGAWFAWGIFEVKAGKEIPFPWLRDSRSGNMGAL